MVRRNLFIFLLTVFFLFSLFPRITAQPAALTLTIHTIAPSCNAPSGAIIATAAGGTAPYTYTFRGINAGSSGYFQGLLPGTYAVAVTDASGTTVSKTVTLTQTINPPQVTVSSYTDPTGCGKDDGMVTLMASGGTPPYSYSSDIRNWQTSNVFANLPANAYS